MASKLFPADLKDILQFLFEFFLWLTSTDFKTFSFFFTSLSDFDLKYESTWEMQSSQMITVQTDNTCC